MTELEWLDIFGDNLRDMLKEADMSQSELAEQIGVEKITVNRYIRKERIPNLKAIINISYVLNCELEDLIDFGDKID